MDDNRDDLLQPSLGGRLRPPEAPYSVQTTFLTGFFGGPFAALAILALNSQRLERLSRDFVVWFALAVVVLAGMAFLSKSEPGAAVMAWVNTQFGASRGMHFVLRLVALAIVGLGYLMHRREQRSTDLLGLERPHGLGPGLACIVAGAIASIFLMGAFPR